MNKRNLLAALSELHTTEKLWGIIVYEIDDNGYLNGLRTSNDQCEKENIIHEIARKQEGQFQRLEGEYIVTFIRQDGIASKGKLLIEKNNNGTYRFEWEIKKYFSSVLYEGVGIKTGDRQFTTIYWQSKKTLF